MRGAKAGTRAARALNQERHLPRVARERWSRDRVYFQIENLNALCALLLPRLSHEKRADRIATAKERATAMRTAASWLPEETTAAAHAYVSAHRADEPDELFGAAFLLKALAPADSRTRALLKSLPPSVAQIVDELST